MAKAKLPKKNNNLREPFSSPSGTVTSSDTNISPPVATAATPLTESIKTEPIKTEPRKPETRKAAGKPEIVRTEPRANLVPINLEDEIRRFAYLLSERRGFEPGHEAEDWLAAEHEVRQRYHQQSA
jgi:hypothetical protein